MVSRLMATVAGILVFGAFGARATVITFDDLSGNVSDPSDGVPIANGYAGLDWTNFNVLNTTAYTYQQSGYVYGTVSPTNVGYDAFGDDATITAPSGTLSLTSGYFTSAWNNGETIDVTGFNGATQVDSTSFVVTSTGASLETFNWTGLTSVTFSPVGGTSAGYAGTGEEFAVDNLSVTLQGGGSLGGGTGAVPEPAAWALMLLGLGAVGAMSRARRSAAMAAA